MEKKEKHVCHQCRGVCSVPLLIGCLYKPYMTDCSMADFHTVLTYKKIRPIVRVSFSTKVNFNTTLALTWFPCNSSIHQSARHGGVLNTLHMGLALVLAWWLRSTHRLILTHLLAECLNETHTEMSSQVVGTVISLQRMPWGPSFSVRNSESPQ